MEEKNNKSVTLRAFSIKCSKLSSNKSDYVEKLKEKLENTVVNDRRMRLSQQDPKKEEDLISYYNASKEKTNTRFLCHCAKQVPLCHYGANSGRNHLHEGRPY